MGDRTAQHNESAAERCIREPDSSLAMAANASRSWTMERASLLSMSLRSRHSVRARFTLRSLAPIAAARSACVRFTFMRMPPSHGSPKAST